MLLLVGDICFVGAGELYCCFARPSHEPAQPKHAILDCFELAAGEPLGEVMGGPPPEGGAPQYFPIDVLIVPH